jgi:hypothetical protein
MGSDLLGTGDGPMLIDVPSIILMAIGRACQHSRFPCNFPGDPTKAHNSDRCLEYGDTFYTLVNITIVALAVRLPITMH